MMTKTLSLTLLFLVLLSGSRGALAEEAAQVSFSQDFSPGLRNALHHYRTGQFDKSDELFTKLLSKHPQQWVIYDLYTNTLEERGAYDRAHKILSQAKRDNAGPAFQKQLAEKSKALQKRRTFAFKMQSISPYDELRVFESADFTVRTNIPMRYDKEILSELGAIFDHTKAILDSKLKKPFPGIAPLKVRLIGRIDNFKALIKNRASVRDNTYESTYYDEKNDELLVYFNGQANWSKIAHGIARYVLKNNYIRNPSLFMATGFSQYTALQYKPSPATEKKQNDALAFLKSSSDVGKWETIEDILDTGSRLETAQRNAPVLQKMTQMRKLFEAASWNLTLFFLDHSTEAQRKMFLAYINIERERSFNFCSNFSNYLKEQSSKTQLTQLNADWKSFLFTRVP